MTAQGISDIRVVMLGFRDAGKSSAGNFILGGQLFHSKTTVQRVKGEGEVAGRHVTVIKAPGWGREQLLKDTSELMKEEITLSVSLCPPGPHSVLLVMRAGMRFTETSRRAAQEHVELLGDRVWSHTTVLFTHGDWLGQRSVKEYIESEGKPLQWLVEICGNRYHVFNSEDEANKAQVSDLFKKIDETVAGNGGHHYEIDAMTLKAIEERNTKEKMRAEQMKSKLEGQRGYLSSTGADDKPLGRTKPVESKPPTDVSKELKMVLLGHTDAGKSSVGNNLLGKKAFHSENTVQSVKNQGEVAGRRVTVVNTPGWGREQRLSDTPDLIRQEIMHSVSQFGKGPHALVLVLHVEKTFTELNRSSVQDHMDLLGAGVWDHTLVVFNCGDGLKDAFIEQYIEREGKPLHWLLGKCGNRYCILNNKSRSDGSFVKDLLEVVDRVIAENSGRHYEMEEKILQEVQQKRKGEVERAKERKEKVMKRWKGLAGSDEEMCESLKKMNTSDKPGSPCSLRELRILLLGYKGAGKTNAGNTILGSEAFHTRQSVQSVKKEARVAGRLVTVIRASDWQREQLLTDTPALTKQEITLSLSMCPPGPHAILLVVSVRIKFTEASRRAMQEHLELLSEKVWSHCMVLFTCEHWLGDITVEQFIEGEGKPLQWLTEKCENRYHVLNYNGGDERGQVTKLLKKIEHMVSGNNSSHFEPDSGEVEGR